MALVHPVKPFEDPLLLVQRNADAIVVDRQDCSVLKVIDVHLDTPVRVVVFDSVFTEIVDDQAEQLSVPVDDTGFPGKFQRNIRSVRFLFQGIHGARRDPVKIHILPDDIFHSLIQMGQLQDIIDQRDHPLRFRIDPL